MSYRRSRATNPTSNDNADMNIIDNPCWGTPDKCSLFDLLKQLDRKKSILHESEEYLVLDKPADLRMDGEYPATVHKLLTFWFPTPSLRQLLAECNEEDRQNDAILLERIAGLHRHPDLPDNELRPCHQLDYATSGVLLVARNRKAAECARISFQSRLAKKTYVALLHGHVNTDSIIQSLSSGTVEWPVLTSKQLEDQIEKLEYLYRKSKRKRRKETFDGYQPPCSLFQKWQQQQKYPTKIGKDNLRPEEWDHIWKQLDFPQEMQTILLQMSWKTAKKQQGVNESFQNASQVYNEIQRDKNERKTETVEDLPIFFKVSGDGPDTFHVSAALCDVPGQFIVQIHPDLPVSTHLQVAEASLDFKPALTKCTILQKAQLKGEPVTKVLLEPRTGRRHQLRIHTALTGHPIVGDQTYQVEGHPDISRRMCLHARRLVPLGETNLDVEAEDAFEEMLRCSG